MHRKAKLLSALILVIPGGAFAQTAARPLPLDDAHIDDLLRLMYEKGSSDLHLAVGIPPVIRVDGAHAGRQRHHARYQTRVSRGGRLERWES